MPHNKVFSKIATLPQSEHQLALAGFLSDTFKEFDIELTVVGGAAVQFYTQADYATKDLDVILYNDTKEIVENVMGKLGFKRTSTYRHFEHSKFPFVIEFPPEPIEVGGRYISKVNLIEMPPYKVRVIKIEDIIMDRIIAGVEWKSERHLDQAKLIWVKNKTLIDLQYLKQFAKEEGYSKELLTIIIN
ncbi:nucleotidyltransferase [bacterium]|nr:nucleotidyltransferase [bacterium]